MSKTRTRYVKPEYNVGDSLKVVLLQIYDMLEIDNMQKSEIKSLIRSIYIERRATAFAVRPLPPSRKYKRDGDDFNTITKYKDPEDSLGNRCLVIKSQVEDMLDLDKLHPVQVLHLIDNLIDEHVDEFDEFDDL